MKGAIRSEIIDKPIETLKLAVPAVLYFIQNNVLQLSSSNLPAMYFKLRIKAKTLVAAICSIMLGQTFVTFKMVGFGNDGNWISQGSTRQIVRIETIGNGKQRGTERFLRIVSQILGCFCSGFAGVYFEK